jgi:hypothetical protein
MEYKIIIVKDGLDALEKELNKLGKHQWDCYQIKYSDEGLLGTYIAFLKRTA